MSDRIVLLNAGRIEQMGTPDALYFDPRSLFAAEFLGIRTSSGDARGRPRAGDGRDGGGPLPQHAGLRLRPGGKPVKIMVRPENVFMLAAAETSDQPNQLPARMVDTITFGGVIKSYVRLADGSDMVVQELTRAGGRPPRRGARSPSPGRRKTPSSSPSRAGSRRPDGGAPAASAMGASAFPLGNWRYLTFGWLFTALSTFGAGYFLGLFTGDIRAAFGLSHGDMGLVFTVTTIAGGVLLVWSGRKIDEVDLRLYGALVCVCFAAGCFVLATSRSILTLCLGLLLVRMCGDWLMVHTATTSLARHLAPSGERP